MKKQFFKKNKGITLITLVITIVILIILATISINAVIGENGLIKRAEKASQMYANAEASDEDALGNLGEYIGNYMPKDNLDILERYFLGEDKKGLSFEKFMDTSTGLFIPNEIISSPNESITILEITSELPEVYVKYENEIYTLGIDEATDMTKYVKKVQDFKVTYTQSEGTDLWSSTVNFEITFLKELDITLEQMKELVVYIYDFSDFNEFKTFVETNFSNSYENVITNLEYSSEEEFLTDIIVLGKGFLDYSNIEKIESMGLKVVSIKTPYDTTLYATNIDANLKCSFCKNGNYDFTIQIGNEVITETVKINNIREYDTQGPHKVKVNSESEFNSDTPALLYSIDRSDEWNELTSELVLECNSTMSIKQNPEVTSHWVDYVAKNEEYYKYFNDDMEEWLVWIDEYDYWSLTYMRDILGSSYSHSVVMLYFYMSGIDYREGAITYYQKDFAEFMDDYYAANKIITDEILAKYPKLSIGVYAPEYVDGVFTFNITKDTNLYIVSCVCLTSDTYVEVVVWDDEKNRKVRRKKKIKDITYEDELLVWDFDKGEFTTAKPLWIMRPKMTTKYNLLKFSDGSELKTINQHRIFNKEAGKFTYPMTDETPIGTTTYTAEGKEVTLVSKEEIVVKEVEYTNVITKYHMNLFAGNILTSCRFSNLYPIEDMKYVKDDRTIVGKEEYEDIPEEYYDGLRLGEQPREVNRENDVHHANSIVEHIKDVYIKNAKEKDTK